MPSSIFGHDLKDVSAKTEAPFIWFRALALLDWLLSSLIVFPSLPPEGGWRDWSSLWPPPLNVWILLRWRRSLPPSSHQQEEGALFGLTCLVECVWQTVFAVWGGWPHHRLPPWPGTRRLCWSALIWYCWVVATAGRRRGRRRRRRRRRVGE